MLSDLRRPAVFTAAAIAGLSALASPPIAAAVAPERSSSSIVVDEPTPAFPCSDGRDVLQTFELTRTVTLFEDASGKLVRESRQARYEGTLYTSDLSRSFSYSGRIRRVLDAATGQVTITGLSEHARLPGPGDAVSSGRLVLDPEADAISFEAGRSRGAFEAAACGYLYLIA